MRVAKVVVHADVASFRYPFFVTGRQPTFDMPPPSTIHGHCASALGRWPAPASFFFGLHFTWRARTSDLEHQHITEPLGPKAKTRVATPDGDLRATTGVTIQPVERDFLFDCLLTLYVPTELVPAFRAPAFPVVLGRSQDLAEVVSAEEVDLAAPSRVRLEHTLLPRSVRPCVRFGATVLLSRYISEPPQREATFAQYIALREPVFLGEGANENRAFMRTPDVDLTDLRADLAHVDDEGFARGVWIHRLTD
jgi:CRISPR-associated protein Cas5t